MCPPGIRIERTRTISAKTKQKGQAKTSDQSKPDKKAHRFQVPFTKKNYLAFGVGLLFVILGYIFLAQPPADGFMSLTLAPILLVFGYCVVFPYAILAREKTKIATKPSA